MSGLVQMALSVCVLANAAFPLALPAARGLSAFSSREQQSLVAARRASECGSLRDLLATLASAKHSGKPFAELAGMSGLSRALVWANRKHMLSISKILGFPESQDVCGSQ